MSALAKELITDDNRVVLGVAPEKKDAPPPTAETLQARRSRAPAPRRSSGGPKRPRAASWWRSRRRRARSRRGAPLPEIGATVLTLSNGVEVWLKPTDFKNDQILFTAYALGGMSLARRGGLQERQLSPPRWSASAAWAGSIRSI